MKRLLVLLLFSGCAPAAVSHSYSTTNQPEWVVAAGERAADFWAEHDVEFYQSAAPQSPVSVKVLPGNDIGLYESGDVFLDPVVEKFESPLARACVLAHEFGHSLGEIHDVQIPSLMNAKFSHPGENGAPTDDCAWSSQDQNQLCGLYPQLCKDN